MKNRKNIKINPDIKILLTLFSFQNEIYQKITLSNYETPKNSKAEDNQAVFIKKSVMEKYKKFYNYEILYNFLKSKKNILDCIKDNKIINTEKLKDIEILKNIILQLPDDFMKKINNIDKNNKNKLIEEIENENKEEWDYKMIKYENNKLCLKLINDFEIINEELFIFLYGQGIKLINPLLGNYIIGNQKIFIILKDSNELFYEIGQIKEDGNFIIEYLFNHKQISYSNNFYAELIKLGLKDLYKLIDKRNEINDILINKNKYKIYKVDVKKITKFIEDKNHITPNNNNNGIRNRYKDNKSIDKINRDNNNSNKIYQKLDNNNLNKYNLNKNNKNEDNNLTQLNINEALFNIISLYLYYKQIKNKNNTKFEEYYLINEDYIIKIKIDIGYKEIYDELNEKLENISENVNDKNIINDCYNLLDQNILKEYSNKKFNKVNIINDYEVEPSLISLNYYDYIEGKQNDSLMIYNNFEILDKNILNLFIINLTECNKLLTKCIFNNGKIIINLPNDLNVNKIVSLIGILEPYYNYFIVEYILIYNNKNNRSKHIKEIISNLDEYLNNINFLNNNSEIVDNNSDIIGTIIKYDNDYNTSFNDININNKVNSNLKDNFISCPKIGLKNIGATSYLNSTLQCFSHIEKFVEFFKYNPQFNDIIKNKTNDINLSTSFKILIGNLWPDNLIQSNQNYYSPKDFKNKITKMSPLFEGDKSNSIKDLIQFIIMKLHKELNKAEKNKNDAFNELVQKDKKSIFNFYIQEFSLNNNSIISDLFFATNCRVTQCSNCNNQMFNFQTYFYLIFPLEEIIRFKNNNMNMNNQNNDSNNIDKNIQNKFYYYMNNIKNLYNDYINSIQNSCVKSKDQFNSFLTNQNNEFKNYILKQQKYYNKMIVNSQQDSSNNNNINNNEVNIYDCFEYYRKINYMTEDEVMHCEFCKATSYFSERTDLTTGPEVLFIILNKPKKTNCNIKFNFCEYLDLSFYIELKNLGCNYNLIGTIINFWESEKQYVVAYCRDPLSERWYKYNDEIVSEINDFQNEVINSSIPDLLIYKKIK